MTKFRNKILRDYFYIDFSFVWDFKNTFLSPLILQSEQINL
ncbi:hypothetical protein FRZ67_19285 [Panacibacter ginsenosidivorans]|uniref:Uncharacterized protein n=1 Tax=Panacibacter ginsenosidivorans TaxID=1813871 RepID=A0A5B8VFB4_9BACT|nr:hypothetical protein FRZ67_19285 [Panacibacter ginsenosidivorans]